MAVLIGIPPAEMTLDPRKFMMHQRRMMAPVIGPKVAARVADLRRQHHPRACASIPERDFPMYLRLLTPRASFRWMSW